MRVPNMEVQQAEGVGIGKHIYEHNFVLIDPGRPNMAVQQAEGGWQWQTHLETGFYPHHQTPDLRHLRGLELFGNRPDFWGIFLPQDERRCAI